MFVLQMGKGAHVAIFAGCEGVEDVGGDEDVKNE